MDGGLVGLEAIIRARSPFSSNSGSDSPFAFRSFLRATSVCRRVVLSISSRRGHDGELVICMFQKVSFCGDVSRIRHHAGAIVQEVSFWDESNNR